MGGGCEPSSCLAGQGWMLLTRSLSIPVWVLEGEAVNYPCGMVPALAGFAKGKVVLTLIQ